MSNAALRQSIARAAYDIGFGAKKHFATFDTVEKLPGWVGFISFAVGVFALIYDPLSAKFVSATLVVAGAAVVYLAFYRSAEYEVAGKALTDIYHELGGLHTELVDGGAAAGIADKIKDCRMRAQQVSLSRQIFLSDWWAHYKFFAQQQTDWIESELNLTWRDKWPASLRVAIVILILLAVAGAVAWWA